MTIGEIVFAILLGVFTVGLGSAAYLVGWHAADIVIKWKNKR